MNERRKELIRRYYENKMQGVELLLDNVWDPHNVGAVSRTADGLGVPTIHLYYTYNECPNMRRMGNSSSSSANRWIHYERVQGDIAEFAQKKKEGGYHFLGAELNADSKSVVELEFPEKTLLVMGSESKGISPEVRQILDGTIYIPMVGMVESYNISVAAAILLYELHRSRGRELTLHVDSTLRGERDHGPTEN